MLSAADTEKLVAVITRIVDMDPMYYDGEWSYEYRMPSSA